MKALSPLAVLAGAAAFLTAAPLGAKILQSVTEGIAQASGREFASSKGGPENNNLRNLDADAEPPANAAATARVDAQTVSKKSHAAATSVSSTGSTSRASAPNSP